MKEWINDCMKDWMNDLIICYATFVHIRTEMGHGKDGESLFSS